MEALLLLSTVVALATLLAYLDAPRRGPRYSGPVYDPQPRPARRAGAVPDRATRDRAVVRAARVRICDICGAATWGISAACGRCGAVDLAPEAKARIKARVMEASASFLVAAQPGTPGGEVATPAGPASPS